MTTEPTQSAEPGPAGASAPRPARHHQIVVVGGGSGGITAAARLCRKLDQPDVAVVEPREHHEYQPFWTLVGAGIVTKEKSRKPERAVMPAKATWIRDAVTEFDPAQNQVVLRSGDRVGYDYLVVAPGIKLNWDQIKGLDEGELGRNGICSNYLYEGCEGTWRTLQEFQGGTAIFTMPQPPIKCGGAPQKIMYLAEDHFRKRGIRDRTKIIYASATPGIFPVKEFAKTLDEVVARKGIETRFEHTLVEIRPGQRQAVFHDAEHDAEVVLDYDMIHLAPPQGPPDVVKESPLADAGGWVDVDRHTLQHTRYPNVFSLGDASSLPTSKTGAAIRKEAPVLVHNLLATMRGDAPASFKRYDGYSSCPLPTGYGKLVLAEFDYDLKPAPSFPFDTTKERRSMYLLKRYGLPALYWRGMLRGRA